MAPPPAPWANDLLIDILLLIFTELCCLADRASFALVRRRWREVAELAKPVSSQIPWLLLPSPSPTPSIISFFSGFRRRIQSLPADFRSERLCGSYPGGWVAVALGPFGEHLLSNIYSGARINLPHRLIDLDIWTVTPVLIRAVMLSAAPTAASCVAGALVCGTSNLAFCNPGDSHWFRYPEIEDLQDMVYYAGEEEKMRGFHVLTGLGDVRVLSFEVVNGEGRRFSIKATSIDYKMPEQAPDTLLSSLPACFSRTGYLVVSPQKLLMVVRYYCRNSQTGARQTKLFRVFEMQVKASAQGDQCSRVWMELDNLDSGVLFVARGSSRAYEASELRRFVGGSIYYLDDAEFNVLPYLQNEGEFPCSDMGMYSMPGTTVRRPGLDAPNADMRPGIYGAKTYLKCWSFDDDGANEQYLVEMTEDEEQRSAGGKIIGTRWSILSEPQSKFSPPIWLCP
ncbi:unnamed protein product [Urochloa humidicola]